MGAVSVVVPRRPAPVHGRVRGGGPIGPGRGPTARPAPPLDAAQLERYLQLPVLAPAIPALARQVAGRSQTPAEIAGRVEAFLRTQFRYTLDIERVSQLDPLQEFLFVRRAGHCEYFAAAMAVMLRSLGVPARVVNGFQRGEWNPYGQYYIVRYYDAHSWVEAFLPDVGWVTFDPTPRATVDRRGSRTPAFLYLDSLRLQWHRYVVNWTLRDQIRAVQSMQFRLAGFRELVGRARRRDAGRLGRTGALAPRRGGRRRRRLGGVAPPSGRDAARRGAALPASTGARSGPPRAGASARPPARPRGSSAAASSISDRRPGAAFTRVTTLYERARFGGTPPSAAELAEAEASLAALGRKSR